MVILLDEQFLVHSAVHKAVFRLLRNCAGDDLHEQLDGRRRKVMGAAGNIARSQPSEFEEDRTCPQMLPITAILLVVSKWSIFYASYAAVYEHSANYS